jgi:eukaryotic-like serine/threonine-protein kinase
MDSSPVSTRSQPKIQNLGRYRLIAQLARGGMGVVYLALVRGPAGFNKLFVVKELKTHLAEDPSFVTMFLEEARLAARLSHPNVVQTIEVGTEGNRHFIAMEYLQGQPLHRLVARAKKTGAALSLEYQLHILVQALEGLRYAHTLADFDGTRLGIVHRDVSPHNIFVTYDGVVKVVDFGIAKALDSSQHTGTGVLKGKVAFMAPELVRGKSADQRVDVFAAGIILWEALAGRRMWADMSNDMAILNALSEGAIPNVRDYRPQVPKELALIADRATAVNPDDRYPNAAALQADLENFLKRPGALNVSTRDVGQFVGELFEEERTKIQSVIDGHLKVLRGVASGEYPQIELATMPSPSQPGMSGMTPSGISIVDFTRPTSTSPPGARDTGSVSIVDKSRANTTLSSASTPPANPKSKLVLVGVAVAAIAAVAIAFGIRSRNANAVATTDIAARSPKAANQGGSAIATDPQAAAADDRVQLTVNASPPSARVAVDDGGLMATPFVSLMPRDGSTHRLRIEAPHFAAKSVTFVANADASIDVSLESQVARFLPVAPTRHAPPPPATHTAATAEPVSPPAPSTTDTKPARPKREIDTSDPYGGK